VDWNPGNTDGSSSGYESFSVGNIDLECVARRIIVKSEQESAEEELARLETELSDLKGTLPEHCYGTKGYIGVHRASPAHWQKIEETEERIKELKSQLANKP
jgi:hypothetical protein